MNIISVTNRENRLHTPYGDKKSPSSFSPKNKVNFTGNLIEKTITKKITKYTNANRLADGIDNALGKGFFQNTLNKANLQIKEEELLVPNQSFIHDLAQTLRFPLDVVMKTSYRVANFASKHGPFKPTAAKLIDENSTLKKYHNKLESEKAREKVYNLLDAYMGNNQKINPDEKEASFVEDIAANVCKFKKNYCTRDERVLNRMSTSTVSALYSANDFYNISMLQTDDKDEAKKAHKGRFKQEMTRMGLSAGATFFTMGLFDRYTKSNILLNAAVIAGSALFSEVLSRVLSKTPLVPLTPQQAEKISKERAEKNPSEQKVEDNKNQQTSGAFKGNLDKSNNIGNIYKDFTNTGGNLMALDMLQNHNADINKTATKSDKKKMSLSAKVAIASGILSGIYILSSIVKGNFKFNKEKIAYCEKYKDELKNLSENEDIINEGKELINKFSKRKDKFSYIEKIKKFLTKGKREINLDELQNKIQSLAEDKDCENYKNVLNTYLEHINNVKGANNSSVLQVSKNRTIPTGIVNGTTKLFKTIYTILSLPGYMLEKAIVKEPESFKAINKLHKKGNMSKYNNELTELYDICMSKNKAENKTNKEIMNAIKSRLENIETSVETGDLANISRTMVTAISTYFFVNDYTNKVLIESAGKNVNEAKEERNERIAHKASNFVINGTLMNLFNTTFKKPLNNSLLGATLIAAATETTNEFLVRKSICQPVTKQDSKQKIIDYEEKQMNKKGIMGAWSRTFKKLTGKKSLTEKNKIDTKNTQSK